MEYVWIARRYFEGRETYMKVFAENEKERAKISVSQMKGAVPDDFNWNSLYYRGNDSIEATSENNDNIELNERLVVQKKSVNP